jgi:hypothetical protein
MVARADECYFFARVSIAGKVSGQGVIADERRDVWRSLRLKAAG